MVEMTYIKDIRSVAELSLPWGKLSNCNILITGATGLIGSCLVEVLMERKQRDYSVTIMGRNSQRIKRLFGKYMHEINFGVIIGDVTKKIESDKVFHYIVHAASGAAPKEFVSHPVEVMKANIDGVINLLDYGKVHHLNRFLYISSGEVYGEGDGRVFTEDYCGFVDGLSPRSCYPISKRAAETLCVSYASEYDVEVVIARPCHVFGPYYTENDNRVYAQFVRNVLQCEDIVMKSTGAQYRSWCYVVDCVSALLHILLKGKNCQAYNIADGMANISIKDLADIIASIGGQKVIVNLPGAEEKKGFNIVKKSVLSSEKIESLGWKAKGTLRENILSTINERKRYEKEGTDIKR